MLATGTLGGILVPCVAFVGVATAIAIPRFSAGT